MNDQVVFRIIKLLAESCFDGHFTVMKFTSNWRVSFGPQPNDLDDIKAMPFGQTLVEAFEKAVESADWPVLIPRTIKVD